MFCAFMLKHVLFCDDCFWFAFIYPQNSLEKWLWKKQNIKEIRNKKKKKRKRKPLGTKRPSLSPSPGPSLPSASAQTHRATPFPLSLSRSGGPAEQQQHPGPGDQAGRPKSWPGRAHLPLPPLSLLCG